MAKRGTLTHRRTRRLAACLHVAPPFALGLMEALWHVTAEHAPDGAIGRLSDQDLADEIYWDGEAGELVAAYLKAGVLEASSAHRLIVHGWSEHADNAVRHKLARAGMTFCDGEPPFRRRASASTDCETPPDHGQTASDHIKTPPDADTPRSDEIEPASDQRPVTSVQQPATSDQTDTPPTPPAGAGGPPGGAVAVGSRLPDGSIALDVDDHGAVVRTRRPGDRDAVSQAVDRLCAVASAGGLPADRPAKRRLRERLLEGEPELAIRAELERAAAARAAAAAGAQPFTPEQAAAEKARIFATHRPPGGAAAADSDLDEAEALRLLAPPARPATRLTPSSTVEIVHNARGSA